MESTDARMTWRELAVLAAGLALALAIAVIWAQTRPDASWTRADSPSAAGAIAQGTDDLPVTYGELGLTRIEAKEGRVRHVFSDGTTTVTMEKSTE